MLPVRTEQGDAVQPKWCQAVGLTRPRPLRYPPAVPSADRAAFADELSRTVTALIARYHDEDAPRGRTHRVLLAIHPSVSAPDPTTSPKEA